jgi:hypothetical protein
MQEKTFEAIDRISDDVDTNDYLGAFMDCLPSDKAGFLPETFIRTAFGMGCNDFATLLDNQDYKVVIIDQASIEDPTKIVPFAAMFHKDINVLKTSLELVNDLARSMQVVKVVKHNEPNNLTN